LLESVDALQPGVDPVPTYAHLVHHLQVIDSKRLKSRPHFISRTARAAATTTREFGRAFVASLGTRSTERHNSFVNGHAFEASRDRRLCKRRDPYCAAAALDNNLAHHVDFDEAPMISTEPAKIPAPSLRAGISGTAAHRESSLLRCEYESESGRRGGRRRDSACCT
jgi:hypothetical protein